MWFNKPSLSKMPPPFKKTNELRLSSQDFSCFIKKQLFLLLLLLLLLLRCGEANKSAKDPNSLFGTVPRWTACRATQRQSREVGRGSVRSLTVDSARRKGRRYSM